MDDLINTLKQQHWLIRTQCKVLEGFCKQDVNAKENIEEFFNERGKFIFHINNFKKSLLPHLALEDAKLYPVLAKSKDPKIRETAEKYSDEMTLISKRTLSFFETYSHLTVDDLSQNEYFKLDLNTIITIIKKRIDIEEQELYPLYSKLKK